MKKLIPYIISYLIITSGTAAYFHFFGRPFVSPYPPNSVTVITTLSHNELAAKLQQVGLPEIPPMRTMTVGPAHMNLAHHFVYYAVILAAFAGLTYFFQRAFRTNVMSHDHDV
ncbi:MAG: hypothetical protein ABR955_11725 [Verrucomicrobiota bacterium]|jgi:hypothetical protein